MRTFDIVYIVNLIPKLLPYTLVTLRIVLISFLLGAFFGGLLAKAKMSQYKWVKKIAFGYTSMIRCTPFIIMLFIVYYAIPIIGGLFGAKNPNLSKSFYAVITLTMYAASNLSDNFRTAYVAVGKGQREAALCSGLTEKQAFIRIIFPQMMYIAVPMISNVIISLMQDTALVFAIGLVDLMGQAKILDSLAYNVHTTEIYILVALLFWLLALLVEKILRVYHLHLGKYTSPRKVKASAGGNV